MQPIFISFAGFELYSLSLFLIASWFVFSFVFWKHLHNQAVDDDRIFDLTFYSTIIAFVGARLAFVVFHWELFAGSWLKVPALWVQPGLSLYGGLVSGLLALLYLARKLKVRVSFVLDSLAFSLPSAILVGLIGSYLDGTTAGKLTGFAWGVLYTGLAGRRHPVQIYEGISLLLIIIIIFFIQRKAVKRGLPYGMTGLWFFFLFSIFMFAIEFVKDSSVYFSGVSANQWVLVGLFAETLGAFYVRGGGKQLIRPAMKHIVSGLTGKFKQLYAKFSQRNSNRY